MRLLFAFLALVTMASTAQAQSSARVRGYTRKNGTYVAPHYRTRPDHSRTNNWSSKGNVNPRTGKKGHVNPYTPKRRYYSRKRH